MSTASRLFLLAAVAVGLFLRLVHFRDWPPGPWIDEAYAVNAARALTKAPAAPFFGLTPLEPPDAGFVNFYVPNPYLYATKVVDRLAGGGLATLRAASILPSLVLLLGALGLAWEASRGRRAVLLSSALLLATSMWLLTTGRWGWHAVSSAALLVLSAWAALAAQRRGSNLLAALAGLFLGAAQYGYPAARLGFLVPLVLLLIDIARRERRAAVRAAVFAGVALVVSSPLVVELFRHPERSLAREKELAIVWKDPAALARNAVSYAALFFVRGDENERHGDPSRPVVPAPVAGLAVLGLGGALSRPGAERTLALWASVFLLGGLLSRGGANAYRISPAAPFLLVLAALGGAFLVERIPLERRRLGTVLVLALVLVSAASDVTAFASWAKSPRTWGAFGGPERELADALVEEGGRGEAPLVLDPRSGARNYHVVEALVGGPGDVGRRVSALDLSRLPEGSGLRREILYADGGVLERSGRLTHFAGRVVRRGADPWGAPTWVLYRLPAGASASAASSAR
ncbi:MAG TPA: hypothetical protein VGR00_03675 [Thermoanaerobaculia bacterium]|nr:hypothetical protein [Thermoanaerobaculia bacterium]